MVAGREILPWFSSGPSSVISSPTASDETNGPNAFPCSWVSLLLRRRKIRFPKIRMLSGRSRGEGVMLPLDLTDDWRDRLGRSMEALIDPWEREDDVKEEMVVVLELLFICSVLARIRSGEGGPSMAASRESGDGALELVAVELFLHRVFFSCLLPSEVIEKLNIIAAGTGSGGLEGYPGVCNSEVTLLARHRLI